MISLLLACSGDGMDTASEARPTRVMPLGDSLTSGYRVPGGYRPQLYSGLVEAGWSLDLVGSLAGDVEGLPDNDHEGHNTYVIDELVPVAAEMVPRYDPDIVLLLIGTNDVVSQDDLDGAPDRLAGLLTLLAGREVLVGTLPPVGNAPAEANIQAYNSAIISVVEDAGMTVVDHHAVMTNEMLVDAVHPDAAGYEAMAGQWLAALTAAE